MEINSELLDEIRKLAKDMKWASTHLQAIHNMIEPQVETEKEDKNQLTIFDSIKNNDNERHN